MIRALALRWSLFGGFLGALAFVEYLQGNFHLTEFTAGMVIGLILCDITRCRFAARLWPLTCQITDWNRVESLLKELRSKEPPPK